MHAEEPRTGNEQQNDRLRCLELAVTRLDSEAKADKEALRLQAVEYARRLDALNHAHEKAIEVQHTYVTADKYEDKLKSETLAREIALQRVDEKFNDYVKRWEVRQQEVDRQIQATKADLAARSAVLEASAHASEKQVDEQARKTNRNIAVMGVVVTIVIAVANYLGTI